MTKPGRISCDVLGCRRTAPAERHAPDTRICCGKCWRLGSTEARAQYRNAERQLRRLPKGHPDAPGWEVDRHLAYERVVREATEARAGVE